MAFSPIAYINVLKCGTSCSEEMWFSIASMCPLRILHQYCTTDHELPDFAQWMLSTYVPIPDKTYYVCQSPVALLVIYIMIRIYRSSKVHTSWSVYYDTLKHPNNTYTYDKNLVTDQMYFTTPKHCLCPTASCNSTYVPISFQ